MKTPMQELIETFKEIQQDQDPFSIHEAIELAESMLETEKEMIMSVYSDGLKNGLHYGRGIIMDSVLDELDYYDLTFKTKER